MNKSLAIVLVSIAAAAVGFGVYYEFASGDTAAAQTNGNETTMVAAAAPNAKAPVTDLPNISLKNRAGEMQSLHSWPGKSMIVNFWATWCGPCRKEIPLLKEIGKKETDFQIVGIAIDYRDDVLKFADEIKIDYPILIGEQDGMAAADAFGVEAAGLPFTAFTDNKGRIVLLLMGELTQAKADIILSNVRRVNKGELTPEAARGTIAAKLQSLSAKA